MANIGMIPLSDTIYSSFTVQRRNGEAGTATATNVINVQVNGVNVPTGPSEVTVSVNQDATPSDVTGFYKLEIDASAATGLNLVDGDHVAIFWEATIQNRDIPRDVSFYVIDTAELGNVPSIS